MENKMKKYTLDEIQDEIIGKIGTPERDVYEHELKMEIIGRMIKQARKSRNLTQEQLGELVGVKKSQISKIENTLNNVTIGTILRVFGALKADVNFNIRINGENLKLV